MSSAKWRPLYLGLNVLISKHAHDDAGLDNFIECSAVYRVDRNATNKIEDMFKETRKI